MLKLAGRTTVVVPALNEAAVIGRLIVLIPKQPALAGTSPTDCPQAEAACAELLSLPLYPGLGETNVAEVAASICDFRPEN